MVGLHICGISDESTEITLSYLNLNDELRWLWNSVYNKVYGDFQQWRISMSIDVSFIALSHIHVSAAYRSRIYENVDTPRSEPYFARATYVPRTCDVPATFPWRIRDVSVFVWNFTFVFMAYQCVCATYVWRMYGV